MAENSRAVVLNVLVEPDAIAGLGQKIGERSLADFERVAAEIVAVQLDQIDWARLDRSGRGRDPPFLFRRYAMELMSCSDVYGFGRKR
jgi:hypothetical protein